ncbi:hypothetical protein [Verrucomicrobium sp. BvORR106]|uniref:hypothetical protein n=1 Tax=Verrucomicrobium sp. BvORR106 TaxID=1403819 RepID=UPI00068EA897|nr:hypothetical protein [Verrucomicrobium sp. BvORR106]
MDSAQLLQKILSSAPKITLNGKVYYIVENDRKVLEEDLPDYAESVCDSSACAAQTNAKSSELVSATLGKRKMRWRAPAILTWKMDEASFLGNKKRLENATKFCKKAAEDWNDAATEKGIYDKIHFEQTDGEAAFQFAFHPFPDSPGLLALAFFPNATKDERFVYIGPGALDEYIGYDQVGIIRHELGHVIGCRHEHILPQAQAGMTEEEKADMEQWVIGKIGGAALTKYDGQSVMHYPIDPTTGKGTYDFKISKLDKEGFAALYSATYDPETIQEFDVKI